MTQINTSFLAFNRGIVSRLGLSRVDLGDFYPFSAERQRNWIPRVLGSMALRPGTEYILTGTGEAVHIPFIFSKADTAIIEMSDLSMRVYVGDEVVSRPSVTASVTNGNFDSDLTGWTDSDEGASTSSFAAGGFLSLVGNGFSFARRDQQVTVTETGTEHALRVVVERGLVSLSVGTSQGDSTYISASLGEGEHSLAFTPSGNFWIRLESNSKRIALVDSINVESSGNVTLTTPFATSDLPNLRWEQSADVIYVASNGKQNYKIERRGVKSWSIVKYLPLDGPFRPINTSSLELTPSTLSGNGTLTASSSYFNSGHAGSLFKLTSTSQEVNVAATGDNQFSGEIRVTGVGSSQRRFSIEVSGTFNATVTLQRSVGEPGNWENVSTYTGATTTTLSDGLDNQIIFYRIGVGSGDYTSGTANATLSYTSGGITGICRVTGVTNSTTADIEIIQDFGSTDGTVLWSEGEWSDFRGWPSAVVLHEGRLAWSGKTKVILSVSDAFESFDEEETEGAASPINKFLGAGAVDDVFWMLSLSRLMVGGGTAEYSVRSTSFGEPLTVDNTNVKDPSTQGSSNVAALKIDNSGLFVQAGGTRLYSLNFSAEIEDYRSSNITLLAPEVAEPSITRLALQRQPDTRIHSMRSDGLVAILVYDPAEKVNAWVEFETAGEVVDAITFPGDGEDIVYYYIKRTIDGNNVFYLEKWAKESEARGGLINKQADSFIVYDDVATTTVTGLSHLEGESVVIWADGKDAGTATVSSGQIILSESASKVVVGLPYTADYKSTKLAYGARKGTALLQPKKVSQLGLVLVDTHYQGVKYGKDENTLYSLPVVIQSRTIASDTVYDQQEIPLTAFGGSWETDSRVFLRAAAPRPATVSAMILGMSVNEK